MQFSEAEEWKVDEECPKCHNHALKTEFGYGWCETKGCDFEWFW